VSAPTTPTSDVAAIAVAHILDVLDHGHRPEPLSRVAAAEVFGPLTGRAYRRHL
jgi:hypothetical protein